MSRDFKTTDVVNIPVDKGSLYQGPKDGGVKIEGPNGATLPEGKALSRPASAPTAAACPKLDVEGCRCNYLGVSAEVTKNAQKEPICFRQAPRWLGNALPCKIPVLLAQPAKSEFVQNERVRDVAVQVLNAIAIEDRCPHMKDGLSGPTCKPLNSPCARPEGHEKCKVFQVLAPMVGIVRGSQALEAVQTAYTAELSKKDE